MAQAPDGLAEMARGLRLYDVAGEGGEGGRERAADERGPLEHGAAGGLDAERVGDAAALAGARRGGRRPPDGLRRERRVAGGTGGIVRRRRHRRPIGGAAGEHEESEKPEEEAAAQRYNLPMSLPDNDRRLAGFRGARVLITGGLGFIGSTLARRLATLGADVLIVDSLIPEYGGNLFNIAGFEDRVSVNISDIRDIYGLKHLLKGRQYLFNLAGQTSHLDSMAEPVIDLEINCRAQLTLLEACRQVAPDIKIVFASTRQIYGRPAYLPVDERHPLHPVDVNGVNKMAGEAYHILYHEVYGIRACALRLTNTYGPRMRIKDARQTFVGIWVRAVLEGKPFEVWGGDQLRDFTYVDDAVDAFLLAATTDAAAGRVFNVGGEEVVSLRELADALVAANGSGRYVVREFPAERKRIDIGDYYAADSLFRETVQWRARVPLAEGLQRTLAFFRENLERYL